MASVHDFKVRTLAAKMRSSVILYIMLAGGFPWTPGDNDCLQNIIAANVSANSRVH